MARVFEARPSQAKAAEWIEGRPACGLWLPMGAGKTASTLQAMERLTDRIEVANWLIVSTPRIAGGVWRDECAEWLQFNRLSSYCLTAADLPTAKVEVVRKGQTVKVLKLVNPTQLKARIYKLIREYDFLTIHVDMLPRLVKLFGDAWPWDGVVLDESDLFKNYDTDRVKALKRVRGYIDRIVQLTGTPSPNGVEQLFSQMLLLDGGRRLGRTLTEFRERFMVPDKRNKDRVFKWKPKVGALEEIEQLIGDIVMSISEEDLGLEMPGRTFNRIMVDLPAGAMARYRDLEREYLMELNGEVIEAVNAAALCGKLRQVANGFVYDENKVAQHVHHAKMEALDELLETAVGPVLLAYEYQEDKQRIKRRYPKAVSIDERPDFEATWNRGEIEFGIMHPQQGAHGLNLQYGGNLFVWYGPTWNLGHYLQANKRLDRPGQEAAVIIHHLVARGTIDEVIMGALQEKGDMQEALIAAVRHRLEAVAGDQMLVHRAA